MGVLYGYGRGATIREIYCMISILIPTVDNLDYLQLACRSFEENTRVPFELMIWDNGSSPEVGKWCQQQEYTYYRSEENIGLSIPYNKMVAEAKYEIILLSGNDVYLLPGWDCITEEIKGKGAWRAPMQISPERPSRAIRGMYGNTVDTFNEKKLLRDYKGKTYPERRIGSFLSAALRKEDYIEIGGYDENHFGGELSFLWRAYNFCKENGRLMLTHPRSYFYHFGTRTPRPRGVMIGSKAWTDCEKQFGISVEQMDKEMNHYAVYGPSLDESGSLIQYP